MRIPEPLAVPVGLREIAANPHALLAEGIEHPPCHIAFGIVLEGMLGDGEIGILRVVHAESVVMLGGEDHVFHTSVLHDFGPLHGVELRRIELVFQPPIPFLVLIVGHIPPASNPVDILGTDAPRLHDAGHRIESPVEDDAELEVAPLVEFFQHLGIGGPFVGSAASVHVGAHFLCRGMEGKACGDGGKRQMSETILEHISIDVRKTRQAETSCSRWGDGGRSPSEKTRQKYT